MVSVCFGTVHPDKSSCWETDEIPDRFRNQPQENCTDEPEPTTLSLPGLPLASVARFLGEFGPCFKLGCSGPSLPTCRRICSPSFMLSLQLPRSGRRQQRPAVSRRAGQPPSRLPGRSSGRTSPGMGSLTRELGWGFFPGALVTEHPPGKVIC